MNREPGCVTSLVRACLIPALVGAIIGFIVVIVVLWYLSYS